MGKIDHADNIGRAFAYTAYLLGGGVIIGLVRTIIAVYYLAKRAIFKDDYKNREPGNLEKKFEQVVEKGKNILNKFSKKVNDEKIFDKKKPAVEIDWKYELARGVSELFWFGAVYFTVADNLPKKKNCYLGINQLTEAVHYEHKLFND